MRSTRVPPGLPIWVIYDHPKDYPHVFVARRWLVDRRGERATDLLLIDEDLGRLRLEMEQRGLIRLDRQPEDDPVILETWV